MPTVVLGAAGFIGSHLVDRLIADRHEILGVDDLSTGRVENLERSIPSGRVAFVYADLSRTDLHDIFAGIEGPRTSISTIFALTSRSDHGVDAAVVRAARSLRARLVLVRSPAEADDRLHRMSREAGVETSTVIVERCYGPRMRFDDSAERNRPFDTVLELHLGSVTEGPARSAYVGDVVNALVRASYDVEGSVVLAVDGHEHADVLSVATDVARAAQADRANPRSGHIFEAPNSLRRGLRATYAWYARATAERVS